jgi:hypothetical protein
MDRIAENQLGLKALDRLSNAQSSAFSRKSHNAKRGHRTPLPAETFDFSSGPYASERAGKSSAETSPITGQENSTHNVPKGLPPKSNGRPKRKRKAMTSVIVDQVSCYHFLCLNFDYLL